MQRGPWPQSFDEVEELSSGETVAPGRRQRRQREKCKKIGTQ